MNIDRHQQLQRVTIGFALLLLGILLVVYVVYALDLMQFPFDYDQGEGFELVDTILFSQGELPYQNINTFPFYASNYPPLYHVLLAPFVWIFGSAYWYGRLFSFLSTLVTAGAIGFTVYRYGTRQRWVALLSALAFLASNTIYHIGPLFRQHISMVMFETLAIVIMAHAYPRRNRRGITLAIILLLAAGYTKQLAAITAIAVFAWMFIQNPRRTIAWLLVFAALGCGIFGLLHVLSDGQWWVHVVVANVNQFNPQQMLALFQLWFRLHAFLIIPAVLLVVYELYFDRLSLFSTWFIFSVVLGGIGAGTWGAGDSYYATAIAAMCILSGICISRLLKHDWNTPQIYLAPIIQILQNLWDRIGWQTVGVILPLLYVGYAVSVWHMPTTGFGFEQLSQVLHLSPNARGNFYDSAPYDIEGYANIGYLLTESDHVAGDRIVARINESQLPVMSEEAGFSLVAGREVISNPTQLLNVWKAGLWDDSALVDMIENREFGLIILRAQFYPTPVLEAIGQYYTRREVIHMNGFDYLLLSPAET